MIRKCKFKYEFDLNNQIKDECYYIKVSKLIFGKEKLFQELYDKLNLPGYFGFNWDALFDCLRDFDWINQKKIIIEHDDLPKLNKKELEIYINLLNDAVDDWKDGEEHELIVIFPKNEKDKVEKLIKKYR